MRTRITVGDVDVRLDGHDLTYTQLKALLRAAASAALAIATKLDTDETTTGNPLGFTAHLELDTGRHDPPRPPWWDDEEP